VRQQILENGGKGK